MSSLAHVLGLGSALVACQRMEPPAAAPPPSVRSAEVVVPTALAPAAPSAESVIALGEPDRAASSAPARVVVDWLKTLGARDIGKLADSTSYPFEFRSTNKVKGCERSVTRAAELRDFVACLRSHESMLMQELGYVESLKVEVVTRQDAPAALRPLLSELRQDDVVASTFINGDGVAFALAVVLRQREAGPRVWLLAVNAEFESG